MNHYGKIMISPWGDLLGDLLMDLLEAPPKSKEICWCRSCAVGTRRERFQNDARHDSEYLTIFDAIHLGSKEIQTRDMNDDVWYLVGGLEDDFYCPQWLGWSNLTNSIILQRGRYTTNQICVGMELSLKHVKTCTSPVLRRKSLRKWDMSKIWMP